MAMAAANGTRGQSTRNFNDENWKESLARPAADTRVQTAVCCLPVICTCLCLASGLDTLRLRGVEMVL